MPSQFDQTMPTWSVLGAHGEIPSYKLTIQAPPTRELIYGRKRNGIKMLGYASRCGGHCKGYQDCNLLGYGSIEPLTDAASPTARQNHNIDNPSRGLDLIYDFNLCRLHRNLSDDSRTVQRYPHRDSIIGTQAEWIIDKLPVPAILPFIGRECSVGLDDKSRNGGIVLEAGLTNLKRHLRTLLEDDWRFHETTIRALASRRISSRHSHRGFLARTRARYRPG